MTLQTRTARDPWRLHEEFVTRAGVIRAAAESLERGWCPHSRERLDTAYAFLTEEFIPSACAQEERRTAMAYRDHVRVECDRCLRQLARLTEQLAEQRAASSENVNIARVRGVLFEIAALVDLHFA